MSNLNLVPAEKELFNICDTISTEDVHGYQLDGLRPKYIAKPETDEGVAQVLALAAKSKTPLAVVGNGTKFVYGSPLNKLEWVLNTAALVSEPIIKTDDLTVVAKAGLPLSVLQTRLNEKGLFLPIDIGTNGATVGGALAHGGGSCHRLAYGMIRDMVLGLTVALSDGKLYKFGGQTVKNVTGYELRKLFIGSKGTLGVITEVCFRVYAIPPASKVLIAAVDDQETAFKTAAYLKELRPAVLEIYDQSSAAQLFSDIKLNQGYLLLVKYSGPNPLVEKKYNDTLGVLAKHQESILREFNSSEESKLWERRADLLEDNFNIGSNSVENIKTDSSMCRVKISIPANQTLTTAQSLEKVFSKYNIRKSALYLPGIGMFCINFNASDNKKILLELQTMIRQTKGFMLLEKGSVELRKEFYSEPWKDLELRIKKYFDPAMVLNPGKRP